jgi:uncharacterized protein
LVTSRARLDTFRQSDESLAGRFFAWRLHPFSVREWATETLIPADEAQRWRRQYIDGLVRNDVLEFSRLYELTAMRLFTDLLRQRVGSPLSLASIARDLNVSPITLKRYLEILEALYIVFVVRPWHHKTARATLQYKR